MKCNGGPGGLNVKMLAKLHARGFYLHPRVPNMTAIAQENNQSFGLIKYPICCQNLQKLTIDYLSAGESTLYVPSLIGLLIFGGTDHMTGVDGYYAEMLLLQHHSLQGRIRLLGRQLGWLLSQ